MVGSLLCLNAMHVSEVGSVPHTASGQSSIVQTSHNLRDLGYVSVLLALGTLTGTANFQVTPTSSHRRTSSQPSYHPTNMVKVTLSGVVIAESDKTIVVEGNHYFPPDAVNTDVLKESSTQ